MATSQVTDVPSVVSTVLSKIEFAFTTIKIIQFQALKICRAIQPGLTKLIFIINETDVLYILFY